MLRLAALSLVAIFLVAGRPALHLLRTAFRDQDDQTPLPPGQIDDASRMNATAVHSVVDVPIQQDRAEEQLATLLQTAREQGLRVSIAGARHSMGGHTLYPNGISINMLPLNHLQLDADTGILRVGAGALWRDIIAYLDGRGRSVAVMQSNNSFSVGGSISVNCHGWQYGKPPISSTVRSLRLMQSDGSIVRCSRTENAELFSLVLGGYGLFGIILEVDLQTVPNRRYRLETSLVPAIDSLDTFDAQVLQRPEVSMVYARMNVSPERFLDDVMLYVLVDEPATDGVIPALSSPGLVSLRRSVFRGAAASAYGKRLRWDAETKYRPNLNGSIYSRNQLLNESVEVFQDRSEKTTDILHEYFVPREHVADFVQDLRTIIPAHAGNLLNVTVRKVETDFDTFLRYADGPVLALVMLFNHERTTIADDQMRSMTSAMIEAVLHRKGRYYLPYRLHATADQFRRAYPQSTAFFHLKRKYDPLELFQNEFYLKYGQANVGTQAN
ncbi:MAG: FAD-binding oxidoreductase [Fuerstiella sp.]